MSAPVGTQLPHHPARGSPVILLRPCHLTSIPKALSLSLSIYQANQGHSHLTKPLCMQVADIDVCQYLIVHASCVHNTWARRDQQNSKIPAPRKQPSNHLKSIRPAHLMQRRCSRHLPHGVQQRSVSRLLVSNYHWTKQEIQFLQFDLKTSSQERM